MRQFLVSHAAIRRRMALWGGAVRLGVLVSGRGTNLQNLIDRDFEVVAVATNRPSCGGAQVARDHGIPLGEFSQKSYAAREERDAAMGDFFATHRTDLLVAAGYDRIHDLHRRFTVINVHPSLLPAFGGGMDAVRQALDYGVKVTGATVHLVTEAVDAGPILAQEAVPVLLGDTEESLLERIHQAEYRILPEAIRMLEPQLAARATFGQ
ncbi:MAG TPA: phosphoribosylglycinamide formyltransferase [Candidatus Dormibacteraeota bacterium]